MQADLHGCQLTVLASKVPRHIGKQGIVIQVNGHSFGERVIPQPAMLPANHPQQFPKRVVMMRRTGTTL